MVDLEHIKSQLKSGKDVEEILEKYDWKNFETIIGDIFKENDFSVKQNFRFKTRRRYEIDVVAVRNNQIFCVDCKLWGRGRYKKTALKDAISKQNERSKEFRRFLQKNPIAKNLLKIKSRYAVHPLLVTLHDEDIVKFDSTFAVPIWKLNRFLVDRNYI